MYRLPTTLGCFHLGNNFCSMYNISVLIYIFAIQDIEAKICF